MIGWQKGSVLARQLQAYRELYGRQVQVVGRIHDDPTYDDKRRLSFYMESVRVHGQKLPGQIRVHALGASGAVRGDTVMVSGKLYPGFGNYQGVISFTPVKVVAKGTNPIESLRRRFFIGVYNALPDPQASLGLGFLVGLKSQLPSDLQNQLRVLALTHIVVASGYNLTILIRLSRRMLARYSKFQAFAGSVALMLVMLAVTGLSPSMARAGVVTFLSLATWYFGRTVHPVLLILLSAALTAWWSPLYIWHDLGWWLSFVAFAGVLLLAPLLHTRFSQRPEPTLVGQILVETIAAEVLVEPLVMLVFGQFSTLGLIANAVVAPFIPLAMLFTFVAGVAGIIVSPIAGWFALPARWILGYIVEVVQLLAKVPWASQKLLLSGIELGLLYSCVVGLGYILYIRTGYRYRRGESVVE